MTPRASVPNDLEKNQPIPAILNFFEQPHDMPNTKRYRELVEAKRDSNDPSSAIYTSRVGRGSQELDPVLRGVLVMSSGKMLKELGY